MKLSNKILSLILLVVVSSFLAKGFVSAAEYDFYITQDTILNYTTGRDYVDVEIVFNREIMNDSYYFSAQGEQIFHIPDSQGVTKERLREEREFKKNSIKVSGKNTSTIDYFVEELELGEGMYVKVPNYTETRYRYDYTVYLSYKSHEYVINSGDVVNIEYPALDEETKLEQIDPDSQTRTGISYNLDVVVDGDIPTLAKAYPKEFQSKTEEEKTIYSFTSQSRLGSPILLEFGTSVVYRFELHLLSEKTDSIVPEKYSNSINTLSTNIYEMAIPREFGETKQRVKIEKIIPTPKKIAMDDEGNVIATFEVPANKDSEIFVSGYIWVEQPSYDSRSEIPTISYEEYRKSIKKDSNLSKYLKSTSYWEVNDSYIQTEAEALLNQQHSLMDIIKADYEYVGSSLTYDESIAEGINSNTRKGARQALQSGTGVCMEYADTLTAILRAQGIAARVAFGYSSSGEDDFAEAGHSWVQAWLPEYGWLTIDPTYEDVNMKIGPDITLILWSTQYDEEDKRIKIFSADSISQDSENLKIKIYPIEEDNIQNSDELLSYADVQFGSDEYSTREIVNMVVKTTTVGKALIIILPIAITLILMILLLSLIVTLIRRAKTRKAHQDSQL